MTDQKSSL